MRVDVGGAHATQLRFHVLCGDDLGVADERAIHWYARSDCTVVDDRLMSRYRRISYPSTTLTLVFGACAAASLVEILERTSRMKFETMEVKWRPMASRLGLPPNLDQTTSEIIELSVSPFAAARRLMHPSQLVDRLIVQERDRTVMEIEALLIRTAHEPGYQRPSQA